MSIISEILDSGTEGGSEVVNYSDTGFFVWIVIVAFLIVALFCIVEVAVYNVRLHRATEFKDKYD